MPAKLVNEFLVRYIKEMESLMIIFMCSQLTAGIAYQGPQYDQACINAMTAASIKTGLRGDINLIQKKAENMARREIMDRTGETMWRVGAAVYVLAGAKKIQFTTPIRPLADSLSASADSQSQSLTLTWTF